MFDPDSPLVKANEAAKRLNKLMEDPQPGLFTWCQMLKDTMQEVHRWTTEWMNN